MNVDTLVNEAQTAVADLASAVTVANLQIGFQQGRLPHETTYEVAFPLQAVACYLTAAYQAIAKGSSAGIFGGSARKKAQEARKLPEDVLTSVRDTARALLKDGSGPLEAGLVAYARGRSGIPLSDTEKGALTPVCKIGEIVSALPKLQAAYRLG